VTEQRFDIFTEEAMTRPLFQEPTDDIMREDPWTGPRGFMFGGMSHPSWRDLAQEYFDAGYLLIECIKRNEWEDYKLGNAALFLFRHSIELSVKDLIGTQPDGHDLVTLADELDRVMVNRHGQQVADWIMARIKEVATIDPASTIVRYPNGRGRKGQAHPLSAGEIYVDLHHLQRAMTTLNAALVGSVAEIVQTQKTSQKKGEAP
jgi:hypothetical protein